MAQFLRPDSDVAVTGWTKFLAAGGSSTSNQYDGIDEASGSPDNDRIVSNLTSAGTTPTAVFGLTALTDPGTSTGWTFTVRTQRSATARSVTCYLHLYDGASEIGTRRSLGAASTTATNVTATVSSTDIDTFRASSDPRVGISADIGSGIAGTSAVIYLIEISAPDAPAQVSNDVDLKYDVANFVSQDVDLKYDVAAFVSQTLAAKYDVAVFVANDLELLYQAEQFASSDVDLAYDRDGYVAAEVDLLYDRPIAATAELSLVYDAEGQVTAGVDLLYDVANAVAAEVALKYDAAQYVAGDVDLLYDVQQNVSQVARLLYDGARYVARTSNLRYDIGEAEAVDQVQSLDGRGRHVRQPEVPSVGL